MFIHIYIPALEAQVERLCRPWLARRPVVVESAAGTVISVWLRVKGIGYGLSAWEARLRCPEAVFFPSDEQKYLFFWEKVCEIAAQYSPSLREEPRHRICLDLAGTELLFGPAKQAAERMVQQIAQAGLIARASIGHSRIMARLAADTVGGSIGEIAAQELAALPIDILPDLDPQMRSVLRDLGLSTFADVQAVPARMLKAAFGEAGERLSCTVRGADLGLRSPDLSGRSRLSTPERLVAEESLQLTPAIDDTAALRGALLSLAESLGRRLRKSGLVTREIRLRIGFRTSREQSFNVSALPVQDLDGALASNEVRTTKLLENATASDDDLFRAAVPALMRTRRAPGRPVRLLALGALRGFRRQAAGQLYFSPLRTQALDRALDKIKDRYGEAALRRASTSRV